MKTLIKKFVLTFLSAVVLFCCVSLLCAKVNVRTTLADQNTELYIEGAQLRYVNPDGIRFVVSVDDDFYTASENEAEFGTLVLPTAMLDGGLTLDTEKVANVKCRTWLENEGTTHTYTAVILGKLNSEYNADTDNPTDKYLAFPSNHYLQELTARAYAIYGETVVYSEPFSTSLGYVASYLANDNDFDPETLEGMYVSGVMGSVFDANDFDIDNAKLYVELGDSYNLYDNIVGADGLYVNFATSDTDKVSIEGSSLTILANGLAHITANCGQDGSAEFDVVGFEPKDIPEDATLISGFTSLTDGFEIVKNPATYSVVDSYTFSGATGSKLGKFTPTATWENGEIRFNLNSHISVYDIMRINFKVYGVSTGVVRVGVNNYGDSWADVSKNAWKDVSISRKTLLDAGITEITDLRIFVGNASNAYVYIDSVYTTPCYNAGEKDITGTLITDFINPDVANVTMNPSEVSVVSTSGMTGVSGDYVAKLVQAAAGDAYRVIYTLNTPFDLLDKEGTITLKCKTENGNGSNVSGFVVLYDEEGNSTSDTGHYLSFGSLTKNKTLTITRDTWDIDCISKIEIKFTTSVDVNPTTIYLDSLSFDEAVEEEDTVKYGYMTEKNVPPASIVVTEFDGSDYTVSKVKTTNSAQTILDTTAESGASGSKYAQFTFTGTWENGSLKLTFAQPVSLENIASVNFRIKRSSGNFYIYFGDRTHVYCAVSSGTDWQTISISVADLIAGNCVMNSTPNGTTKTGISDNQITEIRFEIGTTGTVYLDSMYLIAEEGYEIEVPKNIPDGAILVTGFDGSNYTISKNASYQTILDTTYDSGASGSKYAQITHAKNWDTGAVQIDFNTSISLENVASVNLRVKVSGGQGYIHFGNTNAHVYYRATNTAWQTVSISVSDLQSGVNRDGSGATGNTGTAVGDTISSVLLRNNTAGQSIYLDSMYLIPSEDVEPQEPQEPQELVEKRKLNIDSWIGPQITGSQYDLYSDAGYNVIHVNSTSIFVEGENANYPLLNANLDLLFTYAKANGIKVILAMDAPSTNTESTHSFDFIYDKLKPTLDKWADDDTFYGYMCYDEPDFTHDIDVIDKDENVTTMSEIAYIKQEWDIFHELFPAKKFETVLLSSSSSFGSGISNYSQYIEYYYNNVLQYVPEELRLISFDGYVFDEGDYREDGTLTVLSRYIKSLSIVGEKAELYNAEKWTYIQEYVAIDDVKSVTYQYYTAMAFGYSHFVTYVYARQGWVKNPEYMPDGAKEYEVLVETNGTTTDNYGYFQAAHEEIRSFEEVYMQFIDNWVGVLGKTGSARPFLSSTAWNGTTVLSSYSRISSLTATQDTLIGIMKDAHNNEGFMITNQSNVANNATDTVVITFNNATHARVYGNGDEPQTVELTNGELTINIASGYGAFVIPYSE